ncbi:MAG: YihY/virulence factor BrkB family protein [Treponema sp.]|nr:YihY/virulence factor BrkB family protein [Treponema sp.]
MKKNPMEALQNHGKSLLQRLLITIQLFGRHGMANHAAAGAYGFLLSAVPALLLISIFLLAALRSSPKAVADLIMSINFLKSTFEEESLIAIFQTAVKPGIPGLISVISIIWAARIFALSLQRGLKIIFSGGGLTGNSTEKKRNPLMDNAIIFLIEFLVIVFALVILLCSQTAVRFYEALGYRMASSPLFVTISRHINIIVPAVGLVLISYIFYRIVPARSPSRRAAITGALTCTVLYGIISFFIRLFINQARYNVLYGALGGLILMLVNVYFFFILFFFGAQLAYVIDSFDVLLFSKLRYIRSETPHSRNLVERKIFSAADGHLRKYIRSYKKGETVFFEGDNGQEIYYLISGAADIYLQNTPESPMEKISSFNPGVFFGEMSYLLSEQRTATVMARTDMVVMVLPPAMFDEVLRSDPATARTIIENLSFRLKTTNQKIAKIMGE